MPDLLGKDARLRAALPRHHADINTVAQPVAGDHEDQPIARIVAGGQRSLDGGEIFAHIVAYRFADLLQFQHCQIGLLGYLGLGHTHYVAFNHRCIEIITPQSEQ